MRRLFAALEGDVLQPKLGYLMETQEIFDRKDEIIEFLKLCKSLIIIMKAHTTQMTGRFYL